MIKITWTGLTGPIFRGGPFLREKLMKRVVLIVAVLALVTVAFAALAEKKRDAEVKAMVERAVAMVKTKGLDATLKAINDPKGPFVKGDLYIFAMSLGNKRLAAGSPYNRRLLGTVADKKFNRRMAELAKTKGSGWIEYNWPKPEGNKPSPKRSFIMRVPGQDVYFGCGYYLE